MNLIEKMNAKIFENHISKLSIGIIETHLMEIMKNDSILAKESSNVETQLKSVRNSVKRSDKLLLVQKELYEMLLKRQLESLPKQWFLHLTSPSIMHPLFNELQN
jgi:hypothetical protein